MPTSELKKQGDGFKRCSANNGRDAGVCSTQVKGGSWAVDQCLGDRERAWIHFASGLLKISSGQVLGARDSWRRWACAVPGGIWAGRTDGFGPSPVGAAWSWRRCVLSGAFGLGHSGEGDEGQEWWDLRSEGPEVFSLTLASSLPRPGQGRVLRPRAQPAPVGSWCPL